MKSQSLLPTVALFGVATGGLHPMVSLGLAGLGESEIIVGLVTAVFYLGAFGGAVGCRYLVERLDYRRSIAVVALVASISTAALSFTDLWWVWMFLRLLAGCALGAYYVTIESWIIRATHLGERSVNLATYEVVRMAAVASGPIILSLATLVSGFVGAALAMAAAALPVLLIRGPASNMATTQGPKLLLSLVRRAPTALASCLVAGMYAGSFMGLGALFASSMGVRGASLAAFLSAVLLAPALTQLPLGALADRLGRRFLVLLATGTATIIGTALSVGAGSHPTGMIVLAMAFGGVCYPLYALGTGLMSESLEPTEILAGSGLANVAYNIGAIRGRNKKAWDQQDDAG